MMHPKCLHKSLHCLCIYFRDSRQGFKKVGVHFPCIPCCGFYYILVTDKPFVLLVYRSRVTFKCF